MTKDNWLRAAFRLKEAQNEINLALIEIDYSPESATQEEQVLAGMVAQLSLIRKDIERCRV
jgi:adenosine deaminase